jgi:hypothetical protein
MPPSSIYDKNVKYKNYEHESVFEELKARQKQIDEINEQNDRIKENREIARMEEMRIQREINDTRFRNKESLFQRINE